MMIAYNEKGTSADAAKELHAVINRFQSHQSRTLLPPDSLSIDPFPDRYSINHRLLRIVQNGNGSVLRLKEKDPDVITRMINEGSALSGAAMRNIGLIVVGFFLHDIEAPEDRIRFIQSLREQSPNAILIVADYILCGASQAEILRLCDSDYECKRRKEMGDSEFANTHARLSCDDLVQTVSTAYERAEAKAVPAGRGIAVGVPQIYYPENDIKPNQLLGTKPRMNSILHLPAHDGGSESIFYDNSRHFL